MARPGPKSHEVVIEDLGESVYCLQVELQRLNHNLSKLQGQQEVVADICETLINWTEKSQYFKAHMKRHQDLFAQISESKTFTSRKEKSEDDKE